MGFGFFLTGLHVVGAFEERIGHHRLPTSLTSITSITAPNSPQRRLRRGHSTVGSSSISRGQARRPTTPTSNPLTAAYVMNALTCICFYHSTTPNASSKRGALTPMTIGLTVPSAT